MEIAIKRKALSYSQKSAEIALACLFFIMPFSHTSTVKAFLLVVAMLSIVTKIALGYNRNSPVLTLPHKPLDMIIIASVIWSLVTLMNAFDVSYSLHEIVNKMLKQYVLYFLVFSALRDVSQDVEKVKRVLVPLALAAIVMSLYACYEFSLTPVFFKNRVSGLTGEFYRLAVFLVLALPIIATLAYSYDGWSRWLFLMGIPVSLAAIIFTFTRAAWIAVIAEVSVFIILFFKKYRKIMLSGMIAVSLLFE
jgi:hypothetical protein